MNYIFANNSLDFYICKQVAPYFLSPPFKARPGQEALIDVDMTTQTSFM